MSLLALDTAALIYLSKADLPLPADTADRVRGRKIRRLLEGADQDGDVVVLPAVALAEYLAGDQIPDAVLDQVYLETATVYVILELTAEAAVIAAKIWRKGAKGLSHHAGGRQALKADVYICASAIANSVSKIVTNDSHFTELLTGTGVEVILIDRLSGALTDDVD